LIDNPADDYRDELISNAKLEGDIEFNNVWLAYNTVEQDADPAAAHNSRQDKPRHTSVKQDADPAETKYEWILKDVSFRVRPGEKIALVGHTGSGKTSIVNLILGMYPYQKGRISLDGKELHQYALSDIRNNVGIVQQDVFIFSGTMRENIALNNHELTQAELEQVCQYVNADPFIRQLPQQYDEPVMERGATLSTGQRQLIAFARVLAYDPKIFILDEATSNIDTETEILIQDALQKVMQNRTSIIIAHRLSTIQHVDRILVLHKGEIVEEGSHFELLDKKGLYYDLYRLQYT
jgi:ABC-type multidrug transport system fused ATPase/permease subunit